MFRDAARLTFLGLSGSELSHLGLEPDLKRAVDKRLRFR